MRATNALAHRVDQALREEVLASQDASKKYSNRVAVLQNPERDKVVPVDMSQDEKAREYWVDHVIHQHAANLLNRLLAE